MRHAGLIRSLLILGVAAAVPACGGGGGGGGGGSSVTTVLVSSSAAGVAGNADSDSPAASSTGQFVAFQSTSTNLTSPATTIGNVFRKDMDTQAILRVSRRSNANGNAEPNAASRAPAI